MNKFDVNKNKLEIGDVVVLCTYIESTSREFEFWEVIADNKFTNHSVFIKGLMTGKTDCFCCDGLKKVDKKYKELVDKETPKKVIGQKPLENDVKIGNVTFKKGTSFLSKCPICGKWIHPVYHKNYCGNCGQKLD